jgi:hypothetical protein
MHKLRTIPLQYQNGIRAKWLPAAWHTTRRNPYRRRKAIAAAQNVPHSGTVPLDFFMGEKAERCPSFPREAPLMLRRRQTQPPSSGIEVCPF